MTDTLLTLYTHTFNSLFKGTTGVARYQKGKTNLDFTEARDSEWQWHQLGHMQVCTLLQTDNHVGTLKMRDMKLRDMKMRHQNARVENARH